MRVYVVNVSLAIIVFVILFLLFCNRLFYYIYTHIQYAFSRNKYVLILHIMFFSFIFFFDFFSLFLLYLCILNRNCC